MEKLDELDAVCHDLRHDVMALEMHLREHIKRMKKCPYYNKEGSLCHGIQAKKPSSSEPGPASSCGCNGSV